MRVMRVKDVNRFGEGWEGGERKVEKGEKQSPTAERPHNVNCDGLNTHKNTTKKKKHQTK